MTGPKKKGGIIKMRVIRNVGLLVGLSLLAACAPIEEKPLVSAPEITAPQITQDVPLEEAVDEAVIDQPVMAPVIEDNLTSSGRAVLAEAAPEVVIEDAPKPVQETAQPETVAPVEVAPIEVAPKKQAPVKKQAPPPFDPMILVGTNYSALAADFGAPDLAFDNGGLQIAHYRGTHCLMLIFSQKTSTGLITHIDLRHPTLGKALDKAACHDELGAKKHAKN